MRIISYSFSRYFPLFWHRSVLSLALYPFEISPSKLSASARVLMNITISCRASTDGSLGQGGWVSQA